MLANPLINEFVNLSTLTVLHQQRVLPLSSSVQREFCNKKDRAIAYRLNSFATSFTNRLLRPLQPPSCRKKDGGWKMTKEEEARNNSAQQYKD